MYMDQCIYVSKKNNLKSNLPRLPLWSALDEKKSGPDRQVNKSIE